MCFCQKLQVCTLKLSKISFQECLCACHISIYEKLHNDTSLSAQLEWPSTDVQLLLSLAIEKALIITGQSRRTIILSLDSDDDEEERHQKDIQKCHTLFNKYVTLIRLFAKVLPVAIEIRKAITDHFKIKDSEIPEPIIGPPFLLWLPYSDGINHFNDVCVVFIFIYVLAKKQTYILLNNQ